MNDESFSSKALNITYEKLIEEDEKEYEQILRFQNSTNKVIKIAKECLSNFKKNIFKNYSLLICIDKVSSFKESKIFDSKKFEEILEIFKTEFKEYKEKSNKGELKNENSISISEQNEKRLKFLKFLIDIAIELKLSEVITDVLNDQTILEQNLKKSFIEQFLKEFITKKENLFKKEEIKFYELIILEFNYLENNLEYKAKKIGIDDFNYIIKLKKEFKEFKDIKYLDKFISSFSKQKDKEVIKEMEKFIFDFYNSTQNFNILFNNCYDEYFNSSSEFSNFIDLFKFIINNLEKGYILKERTLSSLSRKAIFKLTLSSSKEKDKKKDLYFYGNTRINEIIDFLNNKFTDYKKEDEYFMIGYKNDKDNKNGKVNISEDEFCLNKTLNELKKGKLEIITKEIITHDQLLDKNNKLTEKFKEILIKWFKKFSENEAEMNRTMFAKLYNALIGYKEQFFHKDSIKILAFLKFNSKSLESITLEEFQNFYQEACNDENKFDDVLSNIRNMDLITERPQEVDQKKLPRYYISNKVDEFKEFFKCNSILYHFKNYLKEDIFDFMSFLSVNEDMYNNVLNKFNKNDDKKFTKKETEYLQNLCNLYIIESIFEDVEIFNNKDNINDNKENKDNKEKKQNQEQNEKILYEDIYLEKLNSFGENNKEKTQFFIDFIENNYSDLVKYTLSILKKLNINKDENDNNNVNNNDNHNNIIILNCINCLNIINNIYNSYHDINSKMDNNNNNNIINIKYKALKNIIEEKKLSNYINDITIYKEIIIQIIQIIEKYFDKLDNKYKTENNEIISALKENCYILLFSLLYTNKESFEIIKKEKEINKLETILNSLYLIDENKINFRLLFVIMFRQIENKIYEEFLSYLIDILFKVFQKYIESDKKKIENGYISMHVKLLLNFGSKKENLKKIIKDEFTKISEKYLNFKNNINSKEKINGEILKNIIEELLTKSLDKIEDEPFRNELKSIIQGEKIPENIIMDVCYFDKNMPKLKSIEEKKISAKKEKYDNLEKVLKKDNNDFFPYDELKENINKINQDNLITNDNDKEKDNLKEMISKCSECLNSKDEGNKNLIQIIKELKEMKETEDKEKNELLSKVHESNDDGKKKKTKRIKKKCDYAGLRNVGSYCYLNSVVQQLFYISQFKYSIMNTDDKKEPNKSDYLDDDNVLHQLQRLFAYLSFTSYGEVIPDDLVKSVKDFNGTPIGPNMDSQEFYSNLCDKIEESLKGTINQYLIKNLFIGKICHKNTCSLCGHESYRNEEFKNITLEVKDMKDIYDSFEKYVSSEDIEDYNCSNCNKKVTMKRNTLLSGLPNILVFHLNRITYDYENGTDQIKINSRFEFPIDLNLNKKYCLEKKNEYYKYKLRGVVIHKGDAQGGHFVSLINVDKDKWYEFNDIIVKEFNINNLEEECFGGMDQNKNEEKKNSAYLLFYELLKKKPIKIKVDDKEGSDFKLKHNEDTICYDKDQFEEIEEKYDITKLKDAYSEEELFKKMFYYSEEYSFYKYIPYDNGDNVQKKVNKKYFSEVFYDNQIYDYNYGSNKVINFNNSLIQLLTEAIEKESFNIINRNLKCEEYKDLVSVLVELIISYFSNDNLKKDKNEKYIKIVNDIIIKIFLPLFKKENQNKFKDFNMDEFIPIIKLLSFL